MRRKTGVLGCFGSLLVTCVLGLFGFYRWDYQTSLTAEAPAEILRVAERGAARDRNRHTVVDYRYVVDGTTYEAQIVKRGPNKRPDASRPDYAVGQPAKVCYNPRSPRTAEVFTPAYRCPDSRWPQIFRQAPRRT
jgi:hypothetical protein